MLYVLTSTHIIEERLARQTHDTEACVSLSDPRRPGHDDHALYTQIHSGVRELGGHFAANAEKVSLGLLLQARKEGWTAVTEVRASHPVSEGGMAERLFLVRDSDPDPVKNRLGILSNDLFRASSQGLLEQLSLPSSPTEAATVTNTAEVQIHATGAVR